jgi:cyclopropane fatty-acyl-phospholipid synthase-like methyltransferase
MESARNSKELWLDVHGAIPDERVLLGRASSAAYRTDPKMLLFMAARYKFVAKLVAGRRDALEIGCGDGFGAPIVAAEVAQLACTDIDEATLADCRQRLGFATNVAFEYFDFRQQAYRRRVDVVYAVDVIEHIFPEEEPAFMANATASLAERGVAVFGTPNVTSERYASPNSRKGHVNLKDHTTLRATMQRYFHDVFVFSMNDEVVHTGYYPMAHYLWTLCVGPRGRP